MPEDYTEVIRWRTSAFVALPAGWRNIYKQGGRYVEMACPGVLVQDAEQTDYFDWRDGRRVGGETHDPPLERVVYADHGDEVGELSPASDADNYDSTLGPDEPLTFNSGDHAELSR